MGGDASSGGPDQTAPCRIVKANLDGTWAVSTPPAAAWSRASLLVCRRRGSHWLSAALGYKRQRVALDVIALMLVARETAANRSVAAVPTGMCTRNLLGRMFD